MPKSSKPRSFLDRKMENAEYRRRHLSSYDAFKLEVQILHAMELKSWSYADLAEAVDTQKSNVSRDLKGGGILNASLSRIARIAEALGMTLITLLVPKEKVSMVLPLIERIVQVSFGTEINQEEQKKENIRSVSPVFSSVNYSGNASSYEPMGVLREGPVPYRVSGGLK